MLSEERYSTFRSRMSSHCRSVSTRLPIGAYDLAITMLCFPFYCFNHGTLRQRGKATFETLWSRIEAANSVTSSQGVTTLIAECVVMGRSKKDYAYITSMHSASSSARTSTHRPDLVARRTAMVDSMMGGTLGQHATSSGFEGAEFRQLSGKEIYTCLHEAITDQRHRYLSGR